MTHFSCLTGALESALQSSPRRKKEKSWGVWHAWIMQHACRVCHDIWENLQERKRAEAEEAETEEDMETYGNFQSFCKLHEVLWLPILQNMVKLWRRLSERSDVRRKAPKAPKALKAGMKRQERPGANCSSMRSLISFGKVSSDVRCKKVSHALLPRQESSGSAFLESLRKHLQKLMPDSCIAMQNRHGSWMVRKDQKKLTLFLVVEVREILTVYIQCYVQITNLWWLMPWCSADSADDFSANVFCCFKILGPFLPGLFFRGEGRADQKMPFNFCSHLLADGLKQEKDDTSWYDTDTGFLDSRLWTWHFRKCKIRRDNTINLQPHMETECWLLVMRGHHAMLALDPLIWMSIIFVPTADQSSSAVFLFWCWQCQKGSVSCNI